LDIQQITSISAEKQNNWNNKPLIKQTVGISRIYFNNSCDGGTTEGCNIIYQDGVKISETLVKKLVKICFYDSLSWSSSGHLFVQLQIQAIQV
jgi:hypothetical protein